MLKNIEHTKGIVIIDFWAPWCGPCRMLSPILDEIKQEQNIELIKVNVDDNSNLVEQFNIQNVPTLVFYKDGILKDTISGLKSKQEILDILVKL